MKPVKTILLQTPLSAQVVADQNDQFPGRGLALYAGHTNLRFNSRRSYVSHCRAFSLEPRSFREPTIGSSDRQHDRISLSYRNNSQSQLWRRLRGGESS